MYNARSGPPFAVSATVADRRRDGRDMADDGGETRLTTFESRCLSTPVNIVEEKVKGIGFQLWPAAPFLCRFLEEQLVPPAPTHDDGGGGARLFELAKPIGELTCLELGAGVGLVGLFMAGLGCKSACVTDLADVCPILQRNVDANPQLAGKVSVRPLAWGTDDWVSVTEESPPDLVLLADCVYWQVNATQPRFSLGICSNERGAAPRGHDPTSSSPHPPPNPVSTISTFSSASEPPLSPPKNRLFQPLPLCSKTGSASSSRSPIRSRRYATGAGRP